MDKIREQITSLRTVQKCVYLAAEAEPAKDISQRCGSAAGTMEAMLKVVEAAEKISIANSWEVHHKAIAELRDTIANLKGEGE